MQAGVRASFAGKLESVGARLADGLESKVESQVVQARCGARFGGVCATLCADTGNLVVVHWEWSAGNAVSLPASLSLSFTVCHLSCTHTWRAGTRCACLARCTFTLFLQWSDCTQSLDIT